MATRRARTPGEVEDLIQETLRRHPDWTPAQVHYEVGGDAVVSRRTVERRHKEYVRKPDTSEAWSLSHGSPEQAALVLPVLPAFLAWAAGLSQGRPSGEHGPLDFLGKAATWAARRMTVDEAELVVRIRTAAPDWGDMRGVLALALLAHGRDAFRREAEAILAYRPWRDGGAELRRAAEDGHVPRIVVRTWEYVAADQVATGDQA